MDGLIAPIRLTLRITILFQLSVARLFNLGEGRSGTFNFRIY